MKKTGLIITVLALLQVSWSQAQTCVDQVRKMYGLLEEKVAKVDEAHPFEMKLTLNVMYSNDENVDSIAYDIHVMSDQSKRYFFSPDNKIYQNEEVTISVGEKQQEIHVFDTPPEEYKNLVTQKYAFFEDTLFSVVDQAAYLGKNKIVLQFDEDNKIAGGIKEIVFTIGTRQMIKSIETNYYEGKRYKSIRADYHKIDFDSKTALLEKELMANVFIGDQLIPTYKNYTLYDHRKNK